MNPGKQFEKDWKASMPDNVYYHRLNDPAQSFAPTGETRFSLQNPFDCIVYRYPNLFCFELKSTKGSSLTFWREDFKEKSFMIKKVQINGLHNAALHDGAVAGLVVNFRSVARTYFIDIDSFISYTSALNKKSVNEDDVIAAGGIIIGQRQLKVNYRYDVEGLLNVTAGRQRDQRAGTADNTSGSISDGTAETKNRRTGKKSKTVRKQERE